MEEETTSLHNRSKYLQEYEATQSQSRPGTPRAVPDNSREAAQTVSIVPSTPQRPSSAHFVPYDEEVEEDDRWGVEEDDDWGQGICGWDDSQRGDGLGGRNTVRRGNTTEVKKAAAVDMSV